MNFRRAHSFVESLLLLLLLVGAFSFSTSIERWFASWEGNRGRAGGPLGLLMGDARKVFANHFFVKADAYFHSGFYPSIYDNREAFQTPHLAEDAGALEGKNHGNERGFLGKPRDWIDGFGRRFFPSYHTHLDQGGSTPETHAPGELSDSSEVREILPWMQLSAEMDPEKIETYLVTAYWLRQRMGKTAEAEAFLRDGLKANPKSYAILFELGRVAEENHQDPQRARNLWTLALRYWEEQESTKENPDSFLLIQILTQLALLEEQQGNFKQALAHMQRWKAASHSPEQVQQRINDLVRIHPGETANISKASK
ncbi:MAG: hypothetical protein JWM68_1913 [Verrucomicrobiales bacterium]|nr:hypothetical protein [Verrucomicrobiales bacterium]